MTKVLLIIVALLVGITLVFGGLFLGQVNATGIQSNWMMGGGQRGLNFIGERGDPVTRDVYPEPGPNMMWNTEYSPMGGFGGNSMMGGNMMGNFTSSTKISVTGKEATEIAQQYLDTYLPGVTADETADPFPGYYTIHILRDGDTIGMLSVNAYTGRVFLHHWHGDFLEMAGEEHD